MVTFWRLRFQWFKSHREKAGRQDRVLIQGGGAVFSCVVAALQQSSEKKKKKTKNHNLDVKLPFQAICSLAHVEGVQHPCAPLMCSADPRSAYVHLVGRVEGKAEGSSVRFSPSWLV